MRIITKGEDFSEPERFREKLKDREFEKIGRIEVVSHARGSAPSGMEKNLKDPSTLMIYCYDSPVSSRTGHIERITTKEETVEIGSAIHDAMELPSSSPEAWKEIKDEGGQIIGWIRGNIVYIRYDMTHNCYSVNSEEIDGMIDYTLDRIEGEYSPMSDGDAEELRKELKEEARKKLIKGMKSRIETEKITIEDQIESIESDITTYQRHIKKAVEDMRMEHKKLKGFEQDVDYESKIQSQIETISGMPKVSDVKVSGNGIEVKTKMLQIEDVNVGRFRIVYRIDNLKKPIVENLDVKEDTEYHHPHIKGTTGVCWGNAGQITEHMAKFDFDVATQMFLTFLESWNSGDPYVGLGNFANECLKEGVVENQKRLDEILEGDE